MTQRLTVLGMGCVKHWKKRPHAGSQKVQPANNFCQFTVKTNKQNQKNPDPVFGHTPRKNRNTEYGIDTKKKSSN